MHTSLEERDDIAIVGMAAHLPGAGDVSRFWDNLRDGRSSIRKLSEEDLREAGESTRNLHHPNYVRAAAVLDGFEMFDTDFFGFSPKESAIMDPQHRQFLEVAWEAFENAGHPPETLNGAVGVFAGCGMGSYFYFNVCSNPDLVDDVGMFLLRHTGNDKDFLSTRVSHVFDLKGPSVNLQTACSTSLVAVHYACAALQSGECDMALAGGVTIELPHGRGYIFKENEILSPDGECHAFDHRAEGTVFGSGSGVVVLRRLEDAIADGDHIWAVIRGSAINNDGAAKAGYLAPSVDGQAGAIAEAHLMAGVSADTIDYVECHGTGTYLGDPIEVAALTEAFRETTEETGFCRIGSVKTNIGHLDTAAGVASLIKASLGLYHRQIPPSLGYEAPNPAIDFDSSPFSVNAELRDWVSYKGPRRAGINSLGVGGTNAHVVIEEAPARAASQPSDWPFHILPVSGRNKAALDANAAALAAHLRAHPEQPLEDVSFTLIEGRRQFEKRRIIVAASHEEAADLLEGANPRRVFDHEPAGSDPEAVFMFPGGGAQYAGMARDLYETEPVFRDWMDRGLAHLQPALDYDLKALWLTEGDGLDAANETLKQPSVQLPLIMMMEYALAQLWMSWGVRPAALVGHSMGENTAACLAGVMSFEDCIGLVHRRGQLFDTVPRGGMLSVPMAASELEPLLERGLEIASVNAPDLCVASGPQAALETLAEKLAALDIECQRVPIDIAAHSSMLDPILDDWRAHLQTLDLRPPQIPVISNRTGQVLTDAEATDPDYWVRHLRGTVNYADCLATLAAGGAGRVFIEMGPGKALSSFARMQADIPAGRIVSVLRHMDEEVSDDVYFIETLGRLWALGLEPDWSQVWGDTPRQRVVLPGYQFQRARYFIEPGTARADTAQDMLVRIENPEDWGYRPVWKPRLAECDVDVAGNLAEAAKETWLVFRDDTGLADRVTERLRASGQTVIDVTSGDGFDRLGEQSYVMNPERGRAAFDQLVADLVERGIAPTRVAHFWLVTGAEKFRPGSSFYHRNQEHGFYSLLYLAQALAAEEIGDMHVLAITSGAAQVREEALPYPEKATIAGPVRVMPRELAGVTAAMLDVELPGRRLKKAAAQAQMNALADRVLEDLLAVPANTVAALRDARRYELDFRHITLGDTEETPLRTGGVYMITGGFGGIGLTLAENLIRKHQARIVLLSRRPLPDRADWAGHLRKYGPHDPTSQAISAVERLEKLGGTVKAAQADVCNLEQMRRLKDEVTRDLGPINGVIHAAGAIDDGPLLAKDDLSIEPVFAAKIHGTQVLDDLFADGELDLLVLFSSTSTITAPAGQVDYVAANEYLNAYARSRRGGRTRVVAINWGLWSQVGMAAGAMAARQGEALAVPAMPIDAVLLSEAGFDGAGERILTGRLDTGCWVIDEHRSKTRDAFLPGTGYLELAAQAMKAQGHDGAFTLSDLIFLRPVQVAEGAARDIRVKLERDGEAYRFVMQSDATFKGRDGWQLNAQASLAAGARRKGPEVIDIAAIRERCPDRADGQGAALPSAQAGHLNFGPRWNVLRDTALGAQEGIARLSLDPAYQSDLDAGYLLHPALLDIATGWAMQLIEGYRSAHLWVPIAYDTVRVLHPLPGEITSWVRGHPDNRTDNPIARFDVTLADAQGRVCVEIEGFQIKMIEDAADITRAVPLSESEVEIEGAAADMRPLSPTEERLRQNLSQGITPPEGAMLFERALGQGLSQVVISSLDLHALTAQVIAGTETREGEGQKFERPDLDSTYVAPSTAIEAALAELWEDLLGVSQVGVEDDFFALGGHSLIAVRLFASIKKTYQVDFPISMLFEAPTIARCAALIAERVGGDTAIGAPGEQSPAEAAPTRRFTHIVPMSTAETGTRTPIFMVAGMFGNVLNLRHLANLLGKDRSFYGLQARGLYGDEGPHETLVEAATDYIAEMREVQPEGPYIIGGFSGGGLTAYEMARQLKEAGETASIVIMLDTPLARRPQLTRQDRMLLKLNQLQREGLGYFSKWARERYHWEMSKIRNRFGGPEEMAGHQFHNADIEAAFYRAIGVYETHPYDGRVALFRPPLDRYWKVSGGRWIDRGKDYVYEDNDWGRYIRDLEVIEVPGDHDSMVLEPSVRVLAERIRMSIREVEDAAADWPEAAE
ncbi:beta-ketoacyl synthase N-terminal-like domain-containing protein [Sedimentitalea sp. XS_ASV28]|uniref:type I polyketide synthase n=1 Tax=Sedimentitalea sp. XS_ASV28 TaxID=3241296 RepID=UPI0035152720